MVWIEEQMAFLRANFILRNSLFEQLLVLEEISTGNVQLGLLSVKSILAAEKSL